MNIRVFWTLALALCLALVRVASAQTTWAQDFTTLGGGVGFEPWQPADPIPHAENGALHLLAGTAKEHTGVLFAPTVKRCAWVQTDFEMRTRGADGAGLIFLDASQLNADKTYRFFGGWDEPNIARGFGIGFDISDPPETNPFNQNGNIDNQPEREISLHWNAIERLNRLSATEFRALGTSDEFVPVRVRLEWVTGGANVSVWVRGDAIYDAVFVPDVTPMDLRVAFGAKSEKAGGVCDLRQFHFASGPPVLAAESPLAVGAIQRDPLTITRNKIDAVADFPRSNMRYGRIIARLTLADVSPAIDAWDRVGKVYLYDEKGERFELARFITPYGRSTDWAIDVSDFRPLLTGKKRIQVDCLTYSAGWTVSLSFDFFPGPAPQYAYKVVNLWNGSVEIGNPKQPASDFWKTRLLTRPRDADSAVIRIMTTGHGQDPNTKNAAEFLPLGRTLTVGTTKYSNVLWKTDNYLNPLRPQGGTWKYSRAGWGPGSVVDAWKTDVSSVIARGQTVPLDYEIEPYLNESTDRGNPPYYEFEAVAVFYHHKS